MKSFFSLIVTILIFSLSFAQNSNDCNILRNKADFADFIKFDENKNVKALNSFIEMKKKEKDELKLLQDGINRNIENYSSYYGQYTKTHYDRYKELKNYLMYLNFQNNDTVKLESDMHNIIFEIKTLLYDNIDFSGITEQNTDS